MPRLVIAALAVVAAIFTSCAAPQSAAPQSAARVEFDGSVVGGTLPEPFNAWPDREWADLVFIVSNAVPQNDVRVDLAIRRDESIEQIWKDQIVPSAYVAGIKAEKDPEQMKEVRRLTKVCALRRAPGKCVIVARTLDWPERELEVDLKGGERTGYMILITALGLLIVPAEELRELGK